MKSNITIVPLALLGIFGCDDTLVGAKQDVADFDRQTQEAASEVAGDVQAFKSETQKELDEIGAEIEQLERSADEQTEEAKREARAQAEALRQRRLQLSARLREVMGQAQSEWKATKVDLKTSVAELGKDVDRALDRLGDAVVETTTPD